MREAGGSLVLSLSSVSTACKESWECERLVTKLVRDGNTPNSHLNKPLVLKWAFDCWPRKTLVLVAFQ